MADGVGNIQLNINVSVQNSAAVSTLNTALSNLGRASSGASGGTNKVTNAATQLATQLKTLKGRLDYWESQYDAIFRASYRLQNVGYGLISTSQRMFTVIKDLTDQWGAFEFMINRAAGALQIWKDVGSGVNPVYTALIENVYSLTKELRLFPAKDVAEATYFWGSTTGQTVNSLKDLKVVMSAVQPIMEIAALTQTSYEAAIKGTYSILVQYHKPLTDVADVTAKLFLVTQRTALEFPDLINAFKFVGPIAGAMGVSFEEVAKTLGELGDAGVRGTMAGRALRQVFIQIERPTAKAKTALDALFESSKAFGRSFESVVFPNGQFIGITNYVNDLAKALQHATQEQRINFLAQTTTANEFSIIVPLVENQIKVLNGAADAYDTTKTSVDDAGYAARQFQKSWELLSTSWNGVIGRLQRGAEVIRLRVGSAIAESLKPAIDEATRFLDKMEQWVQKNPEIVAAISKIVAGIAGLAAIAGGLFLLSGALLGLYAAIMVIFKAFGPLLGVIGAGLGGIIALAEGIIRNWNLINRTVVPAFKALIDALSGGIPTTKALADEWENLHSAINSVVDFLVRSGVGAITNLLNALTQLANSPLRNSLTDLGRVILLAFGLNSIRQILGFVSAIDALKKVTAIGALIGLVALFQLVDKLTNGMALLKVGLLALGVAFLGVIFVVGELRAAFIALATKSPVLILTVVLLVIEQIVNAVDPGAIDNFFGSIADGAEKAKEAVQTLEDTISKLKPADASSIVAGMNKVLNVDAYTSKLDALNSQISGLLNSPDVGKTSTQKRIADLRSQVDALQKDFAAKQGSLATSLQSLADTAGVSEQTFLEKMASFGNSVTGTFEDSKKAASDFFSVIPDGTATVQRAITLWNDMIRQGIHPTISKEAFLRLVVPQDALDQYGRDAAADADIINARIAMSLGHMNIAAGILLSLKANSAAYSDDINSTVTNLLGGLPKTVQAISDQTDQIASQAPGQLLDSLIASFKALGDIPAAISKAIKSAAKLTPANLIKKMFGSGNLNALTEGFLSTAWGVPDFAQKQLDGINLAFSQAVVAAQEAGNEKTFARDIINKYTGSGFQHYLKTHPKLPASVKAAMQDWVDYAYGVLGVLPPSKTVGNAVTSKVKHDVPAWFAKQYKDVLYGTGDTPTPDSAGALAIQKATSGMLNAWTEKGGGKDAISAMANYLTATLTPNLYQGGYNTMDSWINGLKAAWEMYGLPYVKAVGSHIASNWVGKSPPKEGPLSRIDEGGYNIGKAWAMGLANGSKHAVKAATAAATSVNAALQMATHPIDRQPTLEFNANNTRIIKVEVDVSSKDGSINGLDLRVLGESIKPELIRELEHLATV